jgi:hypothetical protein
MLKKYTPWNQEVEDRGMWYFGDSRFNAHLNVILVVQSQRPLLQQKLKIYLKKRLQIEDLLYIGKI